MLDPTTGEFASQDPLEYVDGMSLYRGYFAVGYVDPWGGQTQDVQTDDGFETVVGINTRTMTEDPNISGKTFTAKNCDGTDGCNIGFKFTKAYTGTYSNQGTEFMGVYVKMEVSIADTSKCCCDKLRLLQVASTFRYQDNGGKRTGKPRRPFDGWDGPKGPTRGWFPDANDNETDPYWGVPDRGFIDGIDGAFPEDGKTSPTIFWDAPSGSIRWGNLHLMVDTGKEFVTCAVCEHGGKSRILGCVRWGYGLKLENPKDDLVTPFFDPQSPVASCKVPPEFTAAFGRWNKGEGKTNVPTQ